MIFDKKWDGTFYPIITEDATEKEYSFVMLVS
jgi:hypothetical protein